MPARIDLVVTLPTPPPRHTAHGINAALLQAVQAHDAELASRMHESTPKLYGLSPLLDADDDPHIEIGVLDDTAIGDIVDALADLPEIRIHGLTARIDSIDVYPVPADAFLHDPAPADSWHLDFVTPCLLVNDAFPMPAVLLRSLAWRGRPFIAGLPDERRVERLAKLVDARYDLSLERHLVKVTTASDGKHRRAFELGFVGRANVWCHRDASTLDRAQISGLLGLGSFAGLGRHTAVGMGVLQVTPL